MMNLVTGLVGIAMLLAFLGTLVWWIKELPFTLIVVAVVLMAVYDFVQSVLSGNGSSKR
ncbi:MAG: hypothetical protein OEN50_04320 [Deltaproteobacteria bacterium]|nr:hypothetical protein [Deltaproteobacteria bacterium]